MQGPLLTPHGQKILLLEAITSAVISRCFVRPKALNPEALLSREAEDLVEEENVENVLFKHPKLQEIPENNGCFCHQTYVPIDFLGHASLNNLWHLLVHGSDVHNVSGLMRTTRHEVKLCCLGS